MYVPNLTLVFFLYIVHYPFTRGVHIITRCDHLTNQRKSKKKKNCLKSLCIRLEKTVLRNFHLKTVQQVTSYSIS